MTKEMTTAQYFCVSFEPAVVSMSVECYDKDSDIRNVIENIDLSQKYDFPFMIPRNNYLWVSMAVNGSGVPKKLNCGYVKLTFAAKTRSFEEAGVTCGISYDCKSIQSIENLRQDCILFTVDNGMVSIEYSLSKPTVPAEKKPDDAALENEVPTVPDLSPQNISVDKSADADADLLRDIYADLEVLKYYAAHDADSGVFQCLKSAAEQLELGESVSPQTVYETEEKLAGFISADIELLHRYKTDND